MPKNQKIRKIVNVIIMIRYSMITTIKTIKHTRQAHFLAFLYFYFLVIDVVICFGSDNLVGLLSLLPYMCLICTSKPSQTSPGSTMSYTPQFGQVCISCVRLLGVRRLRLFALPPRINDLRFVVFDLGEFESRSTYSCCTL